jgi:hypothetical protein
LGHFEEGYEQTDDEWDENYWTRKTGLIVLYTICSLWNTVDKIGFSGTRFVVQFGGFWVLLHMILGVTPIKWVYWPIVNNSILLVNFIFWYMRWV